MNRALLLLVLVGVSLQNNPSLGVTVNEKALVPILAKILPKAEGLVKQAVIPDISDSSSFYSLLVQDLKVQDVLGLTTENIKVSFENNQVQVSVKGVVIDVAGNAHIKALFVSANGVLTVKVNDISANIALGQSFSNGRLQLSADQVSVNTGKIDIKITGDLGAEVLSLFASFLEDTLKTEIVKAAQQAIVSTLVPQANAFLASVAYDYALSPSPFSVHLNPTSATSESNGLLSAGVLGYLYNTAIGGTPDVPAPVPFTLSGTNSYAQVQISDYSLNSALWTLHQGNYVASINQTLLDKLNQTSLDGIMNTDNFDMVFPGFQKSFGVNKMVQLNLSTGSQGTVHASESGLEATQEVNVDIMIADEQGVYSSQGYFKASLESSVLVSVTNQKVMVKLTKALANDASSSESYILNNLAERISQGVTQLNSLLAQGFQIPEIAQGKLTNTALINHDQYIVLQSDYELKEVSDETALLIATPISTIVREYLSSSRFQGRFRNFLSSNQATITRLMAMINRTQQTA